MEWANQSSSRLTLCARTRHVAHLAGPRRLGGLPPTHAQLSLPSSAVVLASAGVGAGFLAFPKAAQGVRSPEVLVVFGAVGALTLFPTWALLLASSRLRVSLGQQLPLVGRANVLDLGISAYLLASQIAFLGFLSDFTVSLLTAFGFDATSAAWARPLAIYVSSAAVSCKAASGEVQGVESAAASRVCCLRAASSGGRGRDPLPGTRGASELAGVAPFSFGVAFNVPKVAEEMERRTFATASLCALVSTLLMGAFYGSITLGALASMGQEKAPDCLLDAYPPRNLGVAMCRAGLLVTLLAASALNMVAALEPLRGLGPFKSHAPLVIAASVGCGALAHLLASEAEPLVAVLGTVFGFPEAFAAPALVLVCSPRLLAPSFRAKAAAPLEDV